MMELFSEIYSCYYKVVEETDKYTSYIYYDKQDEKELLIRILSFGPVIKVLGPETFLNLVKDRVKSHCEIFEM